MLYALKRVTCLECTTQLPEANGRMFAAANIALASSAAEDVVRPPPSQNPGLEDTVTRPETERPETNGDVW
eukprot:gene12973-biopygen16984